MCIIGMTLCSVFELLVIKVSVSKNGHFTMIGLPSEGRPLLRAYSFASANYENELEFFSIKVPDGALTSKLQNLAVGDEVLVGKRSHGTLIPDNMIPGKYLYSVEHWNWSCTLYEHHKGS